MVKPMRGFTFNKMQVKKPNYSKFNLSHSSLKAMRSGALVPLWWTDIVPGDSFNVNLSGFMRMLALASPMMQREDITVRAFLVPLRLLAAPDDVERAFTGGRTGSYLNFPMSSCNFGRMDIGSLYDYLDLPLPYFLNSSTGAWEKYESKDIAGVPSISPFPFLAYHRIFNDWFRNEETFDDQFELFVQDFTSLESLDLGSNVPSGNFRYDDLHQVAWDRDYFTSALRSSQRGSQVTIPLLGSAPVIPSGNGIPEFKPNSGTSPFATDTGVSPASSPNELNGYLKGSTSAGNKYLAWDSPKLQVDGSQFSGIGAIALRTAMNLQAFLERNNIAGYRIIENILAHFGVQSSNKLLDYCQYLGGIKSPVSVRAIDQTSASASGSTPQGTQVGNGQAAFSQHLCKFFAEEHSIFMVVGYITSKGSYSQGVARKWTRRTYLDYPWPEFQTVGEQEILNKELFFDFTDLTNNNGTWAYQSRYSEFKYEPDTINGEFRTSLSYWHQSRLWNSLPPFNNSFVTALPSDRIFAVNDYLSSRKYLFDFYFDVTAVRPFDKYATSKLW